jgi:hypothetical protein
LNVNALNWNLVGFSEEDEDFGSDMFEQENQLGVVVVSKPFADFFLHMSFVCFNPKRKEHFRPQLSVLCPPPHLAHFGFVSANLGHVEAVCSFEWNN